MAVFCVSYILLHGHYKNPLYISEVNHKVKDLEFFSSATTVKVWLQ